MSEPGKEDQCSSRSNDGGAQSTVKQRIRNVSRETQKSGEIHLGEYSKQTHQCKISYCVHKVNMKSEWMDPIYLKEYSWFNTVYIYEFGPNVNQ